MKRIDEETTLPEYFKLWIKLYKDGAVREVTLRKYWETYHFIEKNIPILKLKDVTRIKYQELLNLYAQSHERQTVKDFHHQIKAALLDAYDDKLIKKDPTRRIVIKGKKPKKKKTKFLNENELKLLLKQLKTNKNDPSLDWLVLLVAKTGLRFAEALGGTPNDFDFENQTLTINKTWNYKEANGGFQPTKNESSNRKIALDLKTCLQFNNLTLQLNPISPIFVKKRIYNSTVNNFLSNKCIKAGIPEISIHGLRHTHASLLLYAGVSIAGVSKRLGHASITTTENTYLHIIKELETQDNTLIKQHLSQL